MTIRSILGARATYCNPRTEERGVSGTVVQVAPYGNMTGFQVLVLLDDGSMASWSHEQVLISIDTGEGVPGGR